MGKTKLSIDMIELDIQNYDMEFHRFNNIEYTDMGIALEASYCITNSDGTCQYM